MLWMNGLQPAMTNLTLCFEDVDGCWGNSFIIFMLLNHADIK